MNALCACATPAAARLIATNRQYWIPARRGTVVISKADVFILLAVVIAFVLGVYLFFTGHRDQGLFAATWVPAILAFGIYFKLMRRGQ